MHTPFTPRKYRSKKLPCDRVSVLLDGYKFNNDRGDISFTF